MAERPALRSSPDDVYGPSRVPLPVRVRPPGWLWAAAVAGLALALAGALL